MVVLSTMELWVEKPKFCSRAPKNAKADPAVLFLLLPGVGNISVTRGLDDPTGSRRLCVIVCRVCFCVCVRERVQ